MQLQETQVGNTLILEPEGHLDTAAASPLEQEVLQRIEGGARRILVDCSKLEYVNSSGLKVFLIAAKRLDALGGRIAFCALAPNVQMIFDMIGFTKILSIFATREEALASLDEQPAAG
jgi:anti-anti-sigma factor